MSEKIDFSRVLNSHIKPLDFDVIEKAVAGDNISMKLIINHYGPYLKELATKVLSDKVGNEYRVMDETIRCQLENKLIKAVLDFKIQI